MVLKWLRQTRKSVFFRRNELDTQLLAAINAELARQPGLGFSNLCKEALHQLLLNNHSYPDKSLFSTDPRIESLEAQLLSIEQRFFAQEKNRLDRLEAQLAQFSLQMVQLTNAGFAAPISPQPPLDQGSYAEETEETETVPEDPILSRLSSLIDDF